MRYLTPRRLLHIPWGMVRLPCADIWRNVRDGMMDTMVTLGNPMTGPFPFHGEIQDAPHVLEMIRQGLMVNEVESR